MYERYRVLIFGRSILKAKIKEFMYKNIGSFIML